jgi:hypothetical protein
MFQRFDAALLQRLQRLRRCVVAADVPRHREFPGSAERPGAPAARCRCRRTTRAGGVAAANCLTRDVAHRASSRSSAGRSRHNACSRLGLCWRGGSQAQLKAGVGIDADGEPAAAVSGGWRPAVRGRMSRAGGSAPCGGRSALRRYSARRCPPRRRSPTVARRSLPRPPDDDVCRGRAPDANDPI